MYLVSPSTRSLYALLYWLSSYHLLNKEKVIMKALQCMQKFLAKNQTKEALPLAYCHTTKDKRDRKLPMLDIKKCRRLPWHEPN